MDQCRASLCVVTPGPKAHSLVWLCHLLGPCSSLHSVVCRGKVRGCGEGISTCNSIVPEVMHVTSTYISLAGIQSSGSNCKGGWEM